MPFPNQVYIQPAIGVAGDFSDGNPRSFVDAGAAGLIAGTSGVTIGRAAWLSYSTADANGAPAAVNNFGAGVPAGLIHRQQQGLITPYLAEASLVVPAGFPVAVANGGGFFVKNEGSTQALPGQYAYAAYANGAFNFAAASSASTATSTSFTISAQTFSVTASVVGNIMTVSAVGSGTIYPGSVLSAAAGSATVVSQLSGTTGGVGLYTVSIPEQNVAAGTAVTGTYGLLTLGGTITGSFAIGQTLTGTAVAAGSTITANASNGASLTGVGGAGTYITLTATASSGTITAATNVQTGWVAASAGLAGELVKIVGTAY